MYFTSSRLLSFCVTTKYQWLSILAVVIIVDGKTVKVVPNSLVGLTVLTSESMVPVKIRPLRFNEPDDVI